MKDLKGNGIMKMKIWFGLAAAFAAGIASAFNTEDVSGAGVTINATKTLENTTVYNVSGTFTYDLSDHAGASEWVVPEKSTAIPSPPSPPRDPVASAPGRPAPAPPPPWQE